MKLFEIPQRFEKIYSNYAKLLYNCQKPRDSFGNNPFGTWNCWKFHSDFTNIDSDSTKLSNYCQKPLDSWDKCLFPI